MIANLCSESYRSGLGQRRGLDFPECYSGRVKSQHLVYHIGVTQALT